VALRRDGQEWCRRERMRGGRRQRWIRRCAADFVREVRVARSRTTCMKALELPVTLTRAGPALWAVPTFLSVTAIEQKKQACQQTTKKLEAKASGCRAWIRRGRDSTADGAHSRVSGGCTSESGLHAPGTTGARVAFSSMAVDQNFVSDPCSPTRQRIR
jgi:hypothetical protein